MADLLRNSARASKLLPELDKLARNVQRRNGQQAFTGHTAFQDELASKIKAMRDSYARSGVAVSGDWRSAAEPGQALKVASLSGADLHVMLRAGAEEAMEKCAAAGDAATFELCAEAAVALDAAYAIDRYVETGALEKSAAIGETGGALAGAALGALAGGGLKYMLSDPAQKKRGLSRLLDAALLGAAAGGLGGWALSGDGRAPGESEEDRARAAAVSKSVSGDAAGTITAASDASDKQIKKNDKTVKHTFYRSIGEGGSLPVTRFATNIHAAAGWEVGKIQENQETLALQLQALNTSLEAAKAAGDSGAEKAIASRINETAKVMNAVDRNMASKYQRFMDTPTIMAGRDLKGGTSQSLKPLTGLLSTVVYQGKRLFDIGGITDKSEKSRADDVTKPSDVHNDLSAVMEVVKRNSGVLR